MEEGYEIYLSNLISDAYDLEPDLGQLAYLTEKGIKYVREIYGVCDDFDLSSNQLFNTYGSLIKVLSYMEGEHRGVPYGYYEVDLDDEENSARYWKKVKCDSYKDDPDPANAFIFLGGDEE